MRPTSRSEASAVLFGPSRYQNGGYPTGPGIVDAMLKEAEPAIAGTPDPAKTKGLLRLNRDASRGRAISFFANRKAALGLK